MNLITVKASELKEGDFVFLLDPVNRQMMGAGKVRVNDPLTFDAAHETDHVIVSAKGREYPADPKAFIFRKRV